MTSEKQRIKRKFRPEIEGLRTVAAFLVAIYHIWFGNVSGGVDVFFIVSGFLITTSLLSRFERNHKIGFFNYIIGLAKRLFPLAFFVIFVVTIFSILWLPKIRWDQTIQEVFASAFYFQNWQLATNAVDYLAQNNEASPFQHYWAMSIQGQFYLIWPLLLAITIFLARKVFKKSIRSTFLTVLIITFIISLSYSIYKTEVNQPWAYFDTFARVWEFSLGGILALTISRITINKSLSVLLGWLGLFAIISCGVILKVSTVFPGYAALWPTVSALLIILVGNQGGKFGVHRLLSSKPFVKFGSISYAFYLWHWPILIFYFILTGNSQVSFIDGLIMILGSIILSYLTTKIVETPIRSMKSPNTHWKTWSVVAACMIPALITVSLWSGTVQQSSAEYQETQNHEDYPGALVLDPDWNISYSIDEPVRPSPMHARNDLPKMYEDGCHQKLGESELIECAYGNVEDAKFEVALVGGSHSAHWLPTLEEFAEQENIRILSYTKSGCRFTDSTEVLEDCQEWNELLLDKLIQDKPDLVLTIADVNGKDEVPKGFINQWNKLNNAGIDVFAIRDNPRFGFDVASCVEENESNLNECSVKREDVLPENSPWDKLNQKPTNVHYVDLSNYFCEEDICHPVIGNVLVYRDNGHITASYAKTLGPVLQKELMTKLETK